MFSSCICTIRLHGAYDCPFTPLNNDIDLHVYGTINPRRRRPSGHRRQSLKRSAAPRICEIDLPFATSSSCDA